MCQGTWAESLVAEVETEVALHWAPWSKPMHHCLAE